MTQCSLLRGFRGLPRTVQSISDTSGPNSMSNFLQSLPNGRTLPDRHKQGIDYLNTPKNCLRVPQRLNQIKGIIQQISQKLQNTIVFVSWGADNNAQTTNNIYLIVRMESRSFSHNKINSDRSDSFILSDPYTCRSEGDQTNYIETVKKIINNFETNTLPPNPLPLTPPPV